MLEQNVNGNGINGIAIFKIDKKKYLIFLLMLALLAINAERIFQFYISRDSPIAAVLVGIASISSAILQFPPSFLQHFFFSVCQLQIVIKRYKMKLSGN